MRKTERKITRKQAEAITNLFLSGLEDVEWVPFKTIIREPEQKPA